IYPYAQTFHLTTGEERTRAGVLAVMRLHEYEEGVVLPHEETLPKAKEDRFRLLSAAGAQFSPIFGIYDPGEADVRAWLDEAMQAPPAIAAVDTEQAGRSVEAANAYVDEMETEAITAARNVRHRLWSAAEPELIQRFASSLAARQVFIVDGHHRYETALR